MNYERITSDKEFDDVRPSHELRYRIASGFVESQDRVLDAGCGEGYGSKFFNDCYKYVGIDINPVHCSINKFDLETDSYKENLDVFIGFEIIEHLKDVSNFVKIAKQAEKWIIVSTPIIPTKHRNEYHLQDFTPKQIIDLFEDENWLLYGWLKQLEIYGIFIFTRI